MSEKLTIEDIKILEQIPAHTAATAVIVEAKNRQVYEGVVPEADKKKNQVAQEIVTLALDEWQTSPASELQGEIGDDVKAILGLVGVSPDDDGMLHYVEENVAEDAPEQKEQEPEDDGKVPIRIQTADGAAGARWEWTDVLDFVRQGNKLDVLDDYYAKRLEEAKADWAKKAEERGEEPVTEEKPEETPAAADDDTMEEPWEGYDKQTVAQIQQELNAYKEAGQLSEEAIDYVRKYEQQHKHRSSIIKTLKPEEGTPEGTKELDDQLDDAVARDDVKDEAKADDPERDNAPTPEPEPETDVPERDNDVREQHLAGVEKASFEGREKALAKVRKERLPEPPEPSFEDDPVLPPDITAIADDKVNQLMLDFAACLSRATWLIAIHSIEAKSAKRIALRYEKQALVSAERLDPETKKTKLVPVLEAEISLDENVAKWREAQAEAEQQVEAFEALRDGYQASYDALSRVQGFRNDEAKRSR